MAEKQTTKIGAGHAQAMGRMGWQELRNAVAHTGSNVVTNGETGLFGTATPQEVHEQKMNELQPQSEPSPLDAAMQRASDRASTQSQTQKQSIQP